MSVVGPAMSTAIAHALAIGDQPPTTRFTSDGSALFENGNYAILVQDSGRVGVLNKNSGEDYQIWSGVHVEIDGQQAFDFWGHTTFTFEDGTKTTIETTPWQDDPNTAVATIVSIISGNYGVRIQGVDTAADLSFKTIPGHLLDAYVPDGNTLHENPNGPGFIVFGENGQVTIVDQDHISATDLRNLERLAPEILKFLRLFSGLLNVTLAGTYLSSLQIGTDWQDLEQVDDFFTLALRNMLPP